MTGTPSPPSDDIASFARARAHVLARIADACARAGRDPAVVTLVAISKTVPAERLRLAVAAGLTTLGENRVQEAADKVPLLPDVAWHLVGPLQSNKARRAVELFDCIQSVDSLDLARRLDRIAADIRPARPLPVLLQVNVDGDTGKAGFSPDGVTAALPQVLGLANLRVDGLMTIGRLVANPDLARPTFRALRVLADRLRTVDDRIGAALSMGMSADYAEAAEEGATIVRVGRALFGRRGGGA